MIEICKAISINIFWVLTAIFQIGLVTILVLAIIGKVIEKVGKKDDNI